MLANKGYLEIFSKQNEQAEMDLELRTKTQPPLPSNIFASDLEKALDSKYNTGIISTGKKVVERLLKYYVKPMCDNTA